MATSTVWLKMDAKGVVQALQEALEKLAGTQGEVVLDFSSVRRIDPSALRALENLTDALDGNASRVVLHGVNIDVYKVLKLMKLASRFSFRA